MGQYDFERYTIGTLIKEPDGSSHVWVRWKTDIGTEKCVKLGLRYYRPGVPEVISIVGPRLPFWDFIQIKKRILAMKAEKDKDSKRKK